VYIKLKIYIIKIELYNSSLR